MKSLRVLFRFFKAAIEKYNNYKVEYVYTLLLTIPPLFPAIAWYFIVGEGDIAGWSFERLLSLSLFYGIFISLLDISGFWNVWVWMEREDRAVLSSILTKPLNPVLYVYGINMFPASIVKLLIYIALLIFLVVTNGISISLSFVLTLLFSFVSVFLFLSSIIAIMLSYDKSATPLMYIMWNFLRLGDMPVSSIQGFGSFILTYVIPVAFIAVIPSKALETEDFSLILSSFFMSVAMYLVFRISLWHSLKRFEAIGG